MQHHQQVYDTRHSRRPPAGWPGLQAATRRAASVTRAVEVEDHAASAPRGATVDSVLPPSDDLQIRILDRMVGVLTVLVETQERGSVDADDLGLVDLMTQDLDRHLTTLMDARYEPADDARVLAIEHALSSVRARLGEWAAADGG